VSIKNKTFKGILWVFFETFFVKFLYFIVLIFLARWLGPKEFGLIGMISVFIELGKVISESGMSNSLIRTNNIEEKDTSTVFYINLFMSLIAYSITYWIAPSISSFFDQPILVNVIRIYALIFFLLALTSTHLAILTREMKFDIITKISFPGIAIGACAGLYFGFNGFGIWSIVYMYLISELIKTILVWFFLHWRPKLIFSLKKFKYHFSFGYKLMLSSIISITYSNAYNILIGKYFSPQILGYYERSKQFSMYPSNTFTSILSRVTYPLLSSIKNDKNFLDQSYRKIIKTSFFLIAPIMLCLAAIAKPLFLLVLGEKWLPAVVIFQILCLAKMFYPIHAFNLNILKVHGRSDLFLKLEILKKIIVTFSILIAFKFGLLALVWSSVFTSSTTLLINMLYSGKLVNYSIKEQLYDLLVIFLQALIPALLIYLMVNTRFLFDFQLIKLILMTLIAIACYLGFGYANSKSSLHTILSFLKTRKL
jgi:O-antigen/teichoic acid export membrane protein